MMVNTDSSLFASQLAQCLRSEGDRLVKEANATPLRNVQRLLCDWQESSALEEDLCFAFFFLEMFIDKVFYDLSGDVPYLEGVTGPVLQKLWSAIGSAFLELSDILETREREDSRLFKCYQKLGLAYLDAVKSLNDTL